MVVILLLKMANSLTFNITNVPAVFAGPKQIRSNIKDLITHMIQRVK